MTTFISPNLESILSYLNQLEETKTPNWGSMTAQRMVEHLSESLLMSMGKFSVSMAIPEEKLGSMQAFLQGEKPMAQNIKVPFAPENYKLRNESLELAIDELCELWIDFELLYENQAHRSALHPYYGDLDYKGWLRLHSKHFTHHFLQFDLI